MEAMLFGLCLFFSDLIAVLLLAQKKPGLSLIFSCLALVLTGVTAYFWRSMLLAGGKSVELLGFRQYPAALILLGLLALAGLVCLLLGLFLLLRKRRSDS